MTTLFRITDEAIDPAELLGAVPSSADGAVILFWGIVRDHNEGRAVAHLDYDAYPAMAEAIFSEVAAEARQRWSVSGAAIIHRIGRLEIGEASVGIAVASPHREEAYEASRYLIEELKKRAPIWKREEYVDGERRWLGPAAAERIGEQSR